MTQVRVVPITKISLVAQNGQILTNIPASIGRASTTKIDVVMENEPMGVSTRVIGKSIDS